jgi:glycine reductase
MMKPKKFKALHYVNQFFGQEGQEDKADMQFLVKEGPVGPGIALEKILGEKADVVATIICGDNYFAENLETASEQAIELIAPYKPDLFFAGPAFEAGRYGMSCGAICKIVQERLGIPAITGMYEENPGVDLYRKDVYICKTERSASKMVENLNHMVSLALKLLSEKKGSKLIFGENTGRPSEDRYFSRGILRNEFSEKTSAERGVDMLLAKLKGEPFQSEAEGPKIQDTQPPPPIKDLSSCEIALISDGGLTKRGNPDGFKGRGNTVWAAYAIEDFFPDDCSSTDYEIVHTGYYPVNVLDNPNRLVPVDVMRELERDGVIGKLHRIFYSTSGNATIQERCREMGEEIVGQLKDKGVDGAILTST